jgi:O-antigen/teichoic acid export membrane protein
MFGLERLGRRNSRLLFPIKLSVYQPIWIQARWALVGVITTNIQARGYVYLITATAGLEALALVAAAEIVFRPVGLLVTAWGRVSQPRLAELAGHNDIDEYYRIVRYALGILLLANLTLAIGLYITWATVESLLYGERYEDIGYLVIGWGIVVFIASVRAVFSSCLQALKKFRPLATATIVGSAVFLSSALFVLAFLGFRFILISLISAELVTLIYVLAAFFKHRPSANLQYAAATKTCAT